MEKEKIRVENFKIGRDTSSEVNSGIIILIFGILSLCVPLLQFPNIFPNPSDTSYLVQKTIDELTLMLGLSVISFLNDFILFAVIGWSAGGFIAALLYGKEGKNGPLYASYIILRLLLGIIAIASLGSFIAGDEQIPYAVAVIPIVLIISLPMILVGSLAYRIGLWLSPST